MNPTGSENDFQPKLGGHFQPINQERFSGQNHLTAATFGDAHEQEMMEAHTQTYRAKAKKVVSSNSTDKAE